MMKFLQKIKKFWNNCINAPKYQVFLLKKSAFTNKTYKFFVFTLRFKYLIAIWFYTGKPVKDFFKWLIEIFIDGLLILIAYSSWTEPINVWHRIFGYGLTIYVLADLTKKIWAGYLKKETKIIRR